MRHATNLGLAAFDIAQRQHESRKLFLREHGEHIGLILGGVGRAGGGEAVTSARHACVMTSSDKEIRGAIRSIRDAGIRTAISISHRLFSRGKKRRNLYTGVAPHARTGRHTACVAVHEIPDNALFEQGARIVYYMANAQTLRHGARIFNRLLHRFVVGEQARYA